MIVAIIVAVILVIIDQITKYLAVVNIAQQGIESVEFIPGVLKFVYSENDGMALGIGSESFRWVFVAITVIVCAVLIYFMTRENFKHKLFFASVSMIVAGGVGNLIDRVLKGYVVDFLSLSFFEPICNFADYCITAGTITLIVYIIFFYGKKKEPKTTDTITVPVSKADNDVKDNSDEV